MNNKYLLIGVMVAMARQSLATERLKVGDPAPGISAVKWPTGDPVQRLKPDQVYVVEFGFVACGPCRANIPALTEFSNRYGKQVKVVSVFIWENNGKDVENLAYIKKVESFIKEQGKKIGYTTAIDVPEQTTANRWMAAAGRSACPTAFVVKAGKIEWIGDPKSGLERVLEAVVSGRNLNQIRDEIKEDEDRLEAGLKRMWKALEEKQPSLSQQIIDDLIKDYPNKYWLYLDKFDLLSCIDANRAYTFGRWLLDSDRPEFNRLMDKLCCVERGQLTQRDWNLRIEMVNRAIDGCEYVPIISALMTTKARFYYLKGDLRQAVEIQRKAISTLKLWEGYQGNDAQNQESLKTYNARLEHYLYLMGNGY